MSAPSHAPREDWVHESLRLVQNGASIRPVMLGEGYAGFRLRLPATGIRLVCPTFCPSERGQSGDPRRLGFAVTRLRLLLADRTREPSLAQLAAGEGFHPVELDRWCWTAGDAALPDALFAGPSGEAVLLVEGFAPPHASRLAETGPGLRGPAIYLAGDSYPEDQYVEAGMTAALHPVFAERIYRQAAMFAPDEPPGPRPLAERLARLHRLLDGLADPAGAVLIGRSSGARVATLCACARPVAAVICLGYPFRAPGRPPEPDRFAHLATIGTPTLIVQGRADPYGGARIRESYALSAKVRLHIIEATHELHLRPPEWAAVGRRAVRFLAGIEEE